MNRVYMSAILLFLLTSLDSGVFLLWHEGTDPAPLQWACIHANLDVRSSVLIGTLRCVCVRVCMYVYTFDGYCLMLEIHSD